MGAEFRIGDGGNVVSFFIHFSSVEFGFDHHCGQCQQVDFGADSSHVFYSPKSALVDLSGLRITAEAVLVDQVGAK